MYKKIFLKVVSWLVLYGVINKILLFFLIGNSVVLWNGEVMDLLISI